MFERKNLNGVPVGSGSYDVIQDEMYRSNYKDEFNKPDPRKSNFSSTAEKILNSL